MSLAITLAEAGWVPDRLLRIGIRSLLKKRLRKEWARTPTAGEALNQAKRDFSQGPLAVRTEAANEQHYEVPPAFYEIALGPQLKYSSCLYPQGTESLAEAETLMLDTTIKRAELADGQRILEIGCGWGSLTLAMARRYPGAHITAVSNSHGQRQFILAKAAAEGLENISIITADLVELSLAERFDRIVSVECFEHMRNYHELFRRLQEWLKDDGKCFIHVFCHRHLAYPFEDGSEDDWMARHFFTGGTMPSLHLLPALNEHLHCESTWEVNGKHYAKTSRHWLDYIVRRRDEVI
ncbi:MAG: class I SAM-dependent methyltransferase, partial [Planctomycetota bacterium]